MVALALLVGLLPAIVQPAAAAVGTSGNVGDSAGHPYVGWTVSVFGGSGIPSVVATAVTDDAGHWTSDYSGSVDGVAAQSPVTTATATAFVQSASFSPVSPPYDLIVPVVTAAVTVTDRHGVPVPGATVATAGIPEGGGGLNIAPLIAGTSINQASQVPQSAVTDSAGHAELSLLSAAATTTVTVTAPTGSGLQPSTAIPNVTLATASSRTIALPTVDLVHVSGTARDRGGAILPGWGVTFTSGTDTAHAVTTTTAPDGSYGVDVPDTVDRVTLTEYAAPTTPKPTVTSTGLVLSGDTILDLTRPTVDVAVSVEDPDGNPISGAVYVGQLGDPTALIDTGPLFPGATSSKGWQSYVTSLESTPSGPVHVRRLQSPTATASIFADVPIAHLRDWQSASATPALTTDTSVTLQLGLRPTVVIGTTTVTAPASGTTTVQVPVTLSTAPLSSPVDVLWRTLQVDGAPGNQAPPSDYRVGGGNAHFAPGQTSTTVSVDIRGNSTGAPEYVVLSLSSANNANIGGFWGLGFVVINPLPMVVPGAATVAPPTSGTTTLEVPVSLSIPWSDPVTVHWTTLHVDGLSGQAPVGDYVASSGTVTFAPGQTTASVSITVLGNSTGSDELIVVSFTNPTNATMGGFWGLGFGTIGSG